MEGGGEAQLGVVSLEATRLENIQTCSLFCSSRADTSISYHRSRSHHIQQGSIEETGVDSFDESRILVRIDPKYFRPTEVDLLLGDASKAKTVLGWEATTKVRPFVPLNRDLKQLASLVSPTFLTISITPLCDALRSS